MRLLAVVKGRGYAVVPEMRESGESPRRLSIIEVPRNQTTWRTLCRLPAPSPNLSFATVIPGPEQWAVVLKGPVTGFGRQRVRLVVLVEGAGFR